MLNKSLDVRAKQRLSYRVVHYLLLGYIYFAMAFSVLVEILNLRLRKSKTEPVHLHNAYDDKDEAEALRAER
jgi:predicted tellurium resistance membrane protein TerC